VKLGVTVDQGDPAQRQFGEPAVGDGSDDPRDIARRAG
jgi:hypothetical protein